MYDRFGQFLKSGLSGRGTPQGHGPIFERSSQSFTRAGTWFKRTKESLLDRLEKVSRNRQVGLRTRFLRHLELRPTKPRFINAIYTCQHDPGDLRVKNMLVDVFCHSGQRTLCIILKYINLISSCFFKDVLPPRGFFSSENF